MKRVCSRQAAGNPAPQLPPSSAWPRAGAPSSRGSERGAQKGAQKGAQRSREEAASRPRQCHPQPPKVPLWARCLRQSLAFSVVQPPSLAESKLPPHHSQSRRPCEFRPRPALTASHPAGQWELFAPATGRDLFPPLLPLTLILWFRNHT